METIREKEDKLFEEWEKDPSKLENKNLLFCKDGLMFNGELEYVDDEKIQRRKSGDENTKWQKSKKRILFLVKDTNGNPGDDYRTWNREYIIKNRFFKTIAFWFYGLLEIKDNGDYPSFENANKLDTLTKTFCDNPIAIVNCKKDAGGPTLSNEVLLN